MLIQVRISIAPFMDTSSRSRPLLWLANGLVDTSIQSLFKEEKRIRPDASKEQEKARFSAGLCIAFTGAGEGN